MEKESAEIDMVRAAEEDAIDKMEAARQHQVHILDELEGCRKKAWIAPSGNSTTAVLFTRRRELT